MTAKIGPNSRLWAMLTLLLLASAFVHTSRLHAQPGAICCDLIVDIGAEVGCDISLLPTYLIPYTSGMSFHPGSHYTYSVPCPNGLVNVGIVDNDGSITYISHFDEPYYIILNDATCCVIVRLSRTFEGCYHLSVNGYSPCP